VNGRGHCKGHAGRPEKDYRRKAAQPS
jgi:hypothetical protein